LFKLNIKNIFIIIITADLIKKSLLKFNKIKQKTKDIITPKNNVKDEIKM
tara:strand:- start:33 stop:182 length:150 start_codon:yes stop_codon:yes gene_type:complete